MPTHDKTALNFNEGQKSQKVTTKGYNYNGSCNLDYNLNNINELSDKNLSEVWLSCRQGCNLLRISQQAIDKRIKLNKIQSKIVYGNGGKQYRILLQSLPIEVQERYYREFLNDIEDDKTNESSISKTSQELSEVELKSDNIELKETNQVENNINPQLDSQSVASVLSSIDADAIIYKGVELAEAWEPTSTPTASALTFLPANSSIEIIDTLSISAEIYAKSPTFARAFADRWLKIINDIEQLKGSLIDEYILNYNFTEDKKISRTRVYEMRKIYNECGIAALLPQWGQKTATNIDERLYLHFKSAYLKEGSPSVNSSYMQAIGQFIIENNIENLDKLPMPTALKRLLDKRVPAEAQYLARKGEKRYYRNYAPYIERDYSALEVNEVWVSDHAQLDVAVSYKDDAGVERYGFPWITAFRDMKSGLWVGFEIYIGNPNSDRIFSVFRKSAIRYGLPNALLFDNGRDYKAKDFGGKRYKISTDDISKKSETSMLDLLGVKVIYAAPYNAQTKPIERDFRTIKEQFSKQMVGYRGGNIAERPEVLKQEIKAKKISSMSEMKIIFENYVNEVFHKQANFGKNNQGRSRLEVYNSELKTVRTISGDALALFCMRKSQVLTIRRNGVRDAKIGDYYGEFMAGMRGCKVYMRRDFDSYETAYIFDAEIDKLLGVAKLNAFAADVFIGDAVSKEQLKNSLSAKKRDMKRVASRFLDINAPEDNNLIVARMAMTTNIKSTAVAKAEPIYEIMPGSLFEDTIRTIKKIENEGVSDLASIKPTIKEKKVFKMFINESNL